jgi:G-protein signaling modulator 2
VARDELLDLIAGMQSKRMDEQRVELPHLPGLVPPPGQAALQRLGAEAAPGPGPDDNFFDMLMRCQVITSGK